MPDNNAGVGVELAKDLVKSIVEANRNSEVLRDLLVDLRDLLDELNGNFDVLRCAMYKLNEQRGKKLTLADFALAWTEADEEVHSEEEDEPDQGDPLVGSRA